MATRAVAPARPGDVIVATKLHVPSPRRGGVPRDRLVDVLTAAAEARLTLLAAPPGAGKTTLLAEWAASPREERPFAWVSLGPEDNDPARFWALVIAALRTVDSTVGGAAEAALRTPGTSLNGTVLPLLVNDLMERGTDAVLVLDDLHTIRERAVHESLTFLVEHGPPRLQLVVSTRSDPALPLARLRARGELAEVRAADLRFSDDEAAAFLNGALGLALDRAQIGRLTRRTEGWAAGLHLVGLSLRGRDDTAGFIDAFAGDDRQITDFLASEVLDAQPAAVRDFLLRTSVLDRLSAPLCDAVTGRDDGDEMLARLERENLFVVALDTNRRWYRYHHLFGDLLRHRLAIEEPGAIAGLHRRAARWQTEAGAPDDAIRHSLAAGDVDEAAELVARHWTETFNEGHLVTVVRWLDGLPPALVEGDARLWLARAWITMDGGRLDEIDRWLAAAPGDEERGAWPALLRALHAFKTGDVGMARREHAAATSRAGEADAFWTTVHRLVSGVVCFWSGERLEARDAFEDAVRMSSDDGNDLGRTYALGHLAALAVELGDPGGARGRLGEIAALRASEPQVAEHFVALHAHVAAARLHELDGDREQALAEADRAVELSRRGGGVVEIGYALVERLRLAPGPVAQAEAEAAVAACADPGRLADMLAAASPRTTAARDLPSVRDALSPRELGVLRLLPSELSLREIGAELFVSLNTVKSHVRAIYLKLGVASRAEAVTRARELGLLEATAPAGRPAAPLGP